MYILYIYISIGLKKHALGHKQSQASDEHTLNFGLKIRSGPKGPGFGAPKSTLTGNQCTHDEPSGKSFVVFSCFFFWGGARVLISCQFLILPKGN